MLHLESVWLKRANPFIDPHAWAFYTILGKGREAIFTNDSVDEEM